MQPRFVAIVGIFGVAVAAGALFVVSETAATAVPGVRHSALHVNCPPGSHGKPRYARFGESLGYRRDAGTTGEVPLRDRGITGSRETR